MSSRPDDDRDDSNSAGPKQNESPQEILRRLMPASGGQNFWYVLIAVWLLFMAGQLWFDTWTSPEIADTQMAHIELSEEVPSISENDQ